MERPKLTSKATDLARFWAKTGSEILFAESDPFQGKVDREKLEENLYNEILRKIIDHETTDLTENEFKTCVELSKLN